ALAVAQSLEHFAVDDERTARIVVALRDFGIPHELAIAGIDSFHVVSAGKVDLVLINGNATHCDISAEVVFPNDLARGTIDGLKDGTCIRKVNDGVMNDRGGLVGAALIHR